jgi:hypothetical protein
VDRQLNIQETKLRTLINIDINSVENLQYVVTLLRSLNFVKKVEVLSEEVSNNEFPTPSCFQRFYVTAYSV